jgi:hypothetical protein
LEAYGLKESPQQLNKLAPVICPNCTEGNQQQARFCIKCRMILSYDSYLETVEQKEKKNDEVTQLRADFDRLLSDLRKGGKLQPDDKQD